MSARRWILSCVLLTACGHVDKGGPTDASTGGHPDAGVPATPPKLTARTPGPGADFWQRAPIVLTFDQPLDPSTVNDKTVLLDVGGINVPLTVSLSQDHTTVTATFDPLTTPSSPTLSVTGDIKGENGLAFSEVGWGFRIPIWDEATLGAGTDRPSVATADNGDFLVAYVDGSTLHVDRATQTDGSWTSLGDLSGFATAPAHPSLVVNTGDGPFVAFEDGGSVHLLGYFAGAWSSLTEVANASDPRLALNVNGVVYASWVTNGTIVVGFWNGSNFSTKGQPIAASGLADVALATEGLDPLVAFEDAAGDIEVYGWDTNDFTLRTTLTRADSGPSQLTAASASDRAYLAWIDADGLSSYTRITSWNSDGSRIEAPDSLEIDPSGDAAAPALAVGADGNLHAAWIEGGITSRVYVARYTAALDSGRLQVMGTEAFDTPAGRGSLAVAADGDDAVAWVADDGIDVARWNASPEAPHGLAARNPTMTCAIPADGAGFPQTLTDTGCYTSVANRTVAPELIPYDVRSRLWSDGAEKRRFLFVPDGTTVGYTAAGAWTLPVGTILMKEFWFESVTGDPASLIPMETRFLVKRCEPGNCTDEWQGYSYQWNADGTEGNLLVGDTATTYDWPVMDGSTATTHTHIYPARTDCVRCHNAAAGRTLGLQTVQLNRPMRYGNIVDNELRALDTVGLFGNTMPATPSAGLPRPDDPVPGNYRRSRAYFHANCSHCHRPDGEKPTIDFRFETSLTNTGICNVITPGDSANSKLYIKDSTRGGGQMPPIATLLPDPVQLPVTAAWIDSLTTCP